MPIDERRRLIEAIERSAPSSSRRHPGREPSDPPTGPSSTSSTSSTSTTTQRRERATTDTDIAKVVKRYGWVWGVFMTATGALMWAFSLGVASTRYVTIEQRAKDLADEAVQREAFRRQLETISERLTRLEEQVKAMNANVVELKSKLDKPALVVRGPGGQ